MSLQPSPPPATPAPAPADARQHAPAAERNREPIFAVLTRVLPPRGLILEIGSGSGQHAAWFAPRLPEHVWQPSDVDPARLASVEAWARAAPAANLRDPLTLDVAADEWPLTAADAVVAINVLQVAPPETIDHLLRGAARVLPPGGVLVVYGPFREGGVHTAESNAAFDESLRSRNPAWGVRDVDDLRAAGERHGIPLLEQVAMPANNRTLVFRRARA
jgi:SAM-dependent methyltransferase